MPSAAPRPAFLLLLSLATGCAGTADRAHDEDAVRARIRTQQALVEAFFAAPMPRPYTIRVFAHRQPMRAFAAERWNMPDLPCWAVAMGTGSTFCMLSPSVWRTEACEHDRDDAATIDRIVAHELVHVFHGQHRADPEFHAAEDAAWFVEGLAVYVAGQLDAARRRQTLELVLAGQGPTRLADAWTGAARYGVAGSMVELVATRLGRPRLLELMRANTSAEILAAMGLTEAGFLAQWQAFVRGSEDAGEQPAGPRRIGLVLGRERLAHHAFLRAEP